MQNRAANAYIAYCRGMANSSFLSYRILTDKLLSRNVYHGWMTRELCAAIQKFYEDYKAGKRPVLIIQTPPQHGKTTTIIQAVAWIISKDPSLKIFYTSFSDKLGMKTNSKIQRILSSNIYNSLFPFLKIKTIGQKKTAAFIKNSHLITFGNNEGFFANTTINGAITGESLDIGIIDDAVKGRKEASSKTVRESTWNWLTDDFFSRFADDAGMIAIATSWHIDDAMSRLIKNFPEATVLRYPAISEIDDENRKIGEALFPQLKSIDFLLKRKTTMLPFNWSALYQQNPVVVEGETFKREWLLGKSFVLSGLTNEKFLCGINRDSIKKVVQSVDTANKKTKKSDFTSITTWAELLNGDCYLIDVLRRRFIYPELKEATILNFHKFKPDVVLIEDKSSGISLIQDLRKEKINGMNILAMTPCDSKELRAEEASIYHFTGKVYHPVFASWLETYEDELFSFPSSKNDDQVDSTSQFIRWVKGYKKQYNFA